MGTIRWIFALIDSSVINITSLLLGLLGLVLAFIFYKKSQRIKIPTYAIRNFNLVKKNIGRTGAISILYKHRKVNDLSVAKVAFWNNGKDTINKEDIAPKDSIRLVTPSGNRILEANIIYEKNKTNGIKIRTSRNQSELFIDFDYIDFEDGFVLQVFHTGSSSDDLSFKGTVKGAGRIQCITAPFFFRPNSKTLKILNIIKLPENLTRQTRRLIQGLLMFIVPVFAILIELLPPPKIQNRTPVFIGIGLITFLYWYTGYELIKRKVPKGLELYENEIKFDSKM